MTLRLARPDWLVLSDSFGWEWSEISVVQFIHQLANMRVMTEVWHCGAEQDKMNINSPRKSIMTDWFDLGKDKDYIYMCGFEQRMKLSFLGSNLIKCSCRARLIPVFDVCMRMLTADLPFKLFQPTSEDVSGHWVPGTGPASCHCLSGITSCLFSAATSSPWVGRALG